MYVCTLYIFNMTKRLVTDELRVITCKAEYVCLHIPTYIPLIVGQNHAQQFAANVGLTEMCGMSVRVSSKLMDISQLSYVCPNN